MSAPRTSRSAALVFGAVMTTFLFTFANVSCQGQRVASLSGVQLAFGTQVAKSDVWGNAKQEKVPAEPFALFALIAAAGGTALALIGRAVRRLTVAAGLGGAFLLLILIGKLDRDASGMLQVSPGFGLLLAIVLFLVAAAMAWFAGRSPQPTVMPSRTPDKLPDVT